MVIGGDIMLNGIRPSAKTFEGIQKFVVSGDIATANLEIPLTNSRTATSRKTPAELKARSQFILKADPGHGTYIAKTGFDVLSLGNNHAMDYGFSGLQQEQQLLTKLGIDFCGAGKTSLDASGPVVTQTKDGLKVAFVSFLAFKSAGGLWKCTPATAKTPGVATLPGLSNKALKTIIRNAKKGADLAVVWLHWGTERKTLPDIFQIRLGRMFIEAGADAVLGAHPHVLQGAELFAGRPIFYSLGNLISPIGGSTGLFELKFEASKLKEVKMLPCDIRGGRVTPVAKKDTSKAVTRFKSLCSAIAKAFPNKKSSPLPLSN